MHSDDDAGEWLRDVLHDPGWALASWPDAHERVPRAARRQRMRVTAGAALAIAAIVIPLNMFGTAPARSPASAVARPATGREGHGRDRLAGGGSRK